MVVQLVVALGEAWVLKSHAVPGLRCSKFKARALCSCAQHGISSTAIDKTTRSFRKLSFPSLFFPFPLLCWALWKRACVYAYAFALFTAYGNGGVGGASEPLSRPCFFGLSLSRAFTVHPSPLPPRPHSHSPRPSSPEPKKVVMREEKAERW